MKRALFDTPPTHLSVGAVLLNDQHEVLCHYFHKTPWEGLRDIYVLMRETVEEDEPLEAAVARGLAEEFGASGEIIKYLGPLVSHYQDVEAQMMVEKTTLYFLVRLGDLDATKRDETDPEKDSVLEWYPPEVLVDRMQDQGRRYPDRTDLNESEILKRL